MPTRTLGLDLGPNSIGWALIEESDNGKQGDIIGSGVRVFPEGVDNFDSAKEVSRNEARRTARMMRRQTTRRTKRRRALLEAMISAGLWPRESTAQEKLLACDPYELRARALVEQLTPHELGRIFYQLNQRRGFWSNRRRERKNKEASEMLAKIEQNDQAYKDAKCETVGAWLYQLNEKRKHTKRVEDDHTRDRPLSREQIYHEFNLIWQRQCEFGHTSLLTDSLRFGQFGKTDDPIAARLSIKRPKNMSRLEAFGIQGIIFFQRKIYWPKSMIGQCELLPNLKRCPRADRHAQRLRMLLDVNNLRIIDEEQREDRFLSQEERTLLKEKLAQKKEMTFDAIRKALGFLESVEFNLEKGKRSRLLGQPIDSALASANVLGKTWHKRPETEKDAIVRLLCDPARDDDHVAELLINDYGLNETQANAVLEVDIPEGYSQFSLTAIDRLLPHLEAGKFLSANDPSDSAIHAAGFERRDQLQKYLFNKLPDPQRSRNCPIADIPNPVVKRALVELRKVVNLVIRVHGKPDEIHVEMGRDLKTRPKKGTPGYRKYVDHLNEMRDREENRRLAAEKIRSIKNAGKVTADKIHRYLLWEEQAHICPYSGDCIPQTRIFGNETQVDHILPYSKSLDDSQMNKVLCYRKANRDKGQRTVHEWLADNDPQRYEEVCQRARHLPYLKRRRFLQKQASDGDFIERQLNDTRYIAKATGEYLRCLFDDASKVIGLKGKHTAVLRRHWGLDTILEGLPNSPAWQDEANLRPGAKNRADHRHHAIDAIVIALVNRSRLQQMSGRFVDVEQVDQETGEVTVETQYHGKRIAPPWSKTDIRKAAIDAVHDLNISHRVNRKVSGALHEDTIYRPTDQPDVFVSRKAIGDLTPAMIPDICDKTIRELIEARLKEHGIEFGRKKDPPAGAIKKALCDPDNPLTMSSDVPIKRVRVRKKEQTITPIRTGTPNEAYVKPGSTHHLCIFEWEVDGKTKRDAVFVTMLEAVNRIKAQQQRVEQLLGYTPSKRSRRKPEVQRAMSQAEKELPLIQRVHPERPEAKFVMSLSRGEMVLGNFKGKERLCVFRTAASTSHQMSFVEHTDAREKLKTHDSKPKAAILSAQPNTLDAHKVTVDPLGRIRWAND